MAEYLIQGETLESIADKIRFLNGIEDSLTTAQMDSNLDEANTEVDEQANLIAQISSALEGKAGGEGGSASYDTCTVEIIALRGKLNGYCFTCFDGTNIVYKHAFSDDNLGNVTIEDVICGSSFSLIHNAAFGDVNYGNTILVGMHYARGSICIAPYNAGTNLQIQIGGIIPDYGGGSD